MTRALLEAALAHHQAGRFEEAENHYARVLAENPDDLNAIYLSGVLAHQRGRHEEAIAKIARAIAAKPQIADFHNNLGEALRALGRTDEAEAAYLRALALNPHLVGAIANLATLQRDRGRFADAIAGYRHALSLQDSADLHNNLGTALAADGDEDGAIAAYQAALARDPAHVDALGNLANLYEVKGSVESAESLWRKALEIRPDHFNSLRGLAVAALSAADYARSDSFMLRALATETARPVERAVLESGRLFTMMLRDDVDVAQVAARHRDWGRRFTDPLPRPASYANTRDPERRLRIGYVSPDFRSHSVAVFLLPVLVARDRAAVEVICYSNVQRPDAATERIKTLADGWRDIVFEDDVNVARRILDDGVDILIDLAGHTGSNRLLLFGRKPAPVQASWLGYPCTTGVRQIDWRVSDAICDPPEDDAFSVERVLRLPGFHCFAPLKQAPDVVMPDGPITFGSLNNFAKISPTTLALWGRVLAAVPGSRLVLKSSGKGDQSILDALMRRCGAAGIDPARLEIMAGIERIEDHLAVYNRIDVALDTYPYNGTTTTCEALWMGVPVVTLKGDRHCTRVSASLLTQVGLTELIAGNGDDYVRLAVDLANDESRRQALRFGMRARMQGSALLDPVRFTRSFENGLRAMWRDYCSARDAAP